MLCYSLKHKQAAHTHAHKSVLSKIIFFKCLFEQDYRWFTVNRKGEIVPYSNKRHQQEHKKLNYLNTKTETNNTKLASFKRRGHHHRWLLTFITAVCVLLSCHDSVKGVTVVSKVQNRNRYRASLSIHKTIIVPDYELLEEEEQGIFHNKTRSYRTLKETALSR